MVGQKTEAIYRRYVIADESLFREGAVKLEALLQAQRGAMRVVVPLRTGRVTAKSRPGTARRHASRRISPGYRWVVLTCTCSHIASHTVHLNQVGPRPDVPLHERSVDDSGLNLPDVLDQYFHVVLTPSLMAGE